MAFLTRKTRYLLFSFGIALASCVCMALVSWSASRRVGRLRDQFERLSSDLEQRITDLENRPAAPAPPSQAEREADGSARAESSPAYVLHVGRSGKWWYCDIRYSGGEMHRAFFRNQRELNQILRISKDRVDYPVSSPSDYSEFEDFEEI